MTSSNRRSALREINAYTLASSPSIQNISFELPLTPVSPDEEVIKLRGQRRNTQMETRLTPPRTPSKSPRKARSPNKNSTPNKNLSTPLRTSPRKRLNLLESLSDGSGTSRTKKNTPVEKRARIQKPKNVETSLNGLSKDQLVTLLKELIIDYPSMKEAIQERLPTPDLSPLDQKLNYLQRNIYKSFPYTKWGSNRDAFCYRRVQTHIAAFKKECTEQGRLLITSQQWETALEYVIMAWKYVQSLPDWEDPVHNKSKNQCFKSLATNCMTALKKVSPERDELEELRDKIKSMCDDNDAMAPCLKRVEQLLQ